MITADHPRGLSAGAGPRSFVLQTPNAGSLIDFSAEMIRAPGGNARMSNWSDDGQPPSIVESTLLAGVRMPLLLGPLVHQHIHSSKLLRGMLGTADQIGTHECDLWVS